MTVITRRKFAAICAAAAWPLMAHAQQVKRIGTRASNVDAIRGMTVISGKVAQLPSHATEEGGLETRNP